MGRHNALKRFLAAVVAVLLPIWPADASSPPSHERSELGPAWFSFRFRVDEPGRVTYGVEGDVSGSTTTGLGYWRLLADGSLASGFGFVQYGNGEQRHIEMPGPVGIIDSVNTNSSSSTPGLSSGGTFDPGVYTVVLMLASSGEVAQTRAEIQGSGITLLGSSSGSGVFMRWEGDFSGGMNVAVSRPPARAAAAASAATVETTDHRLFGWFSAAPYGAQVSRLTWKGPEGRGATAVTGVNPGGLFLTAEPAGQHTFQIDATAGAVLASTTVFGGGVDLP